MDINATIEQVERLYQTITGHQMPPADPSANPIPPEHDPRRFLDEQFDRLGKALADISTETGLRPAWAPALSAWETATHFVMTLALPGVPRERVHVTRLRDTIVVEGDRGRPDELGLEAGTLTMSEEPRGPFRRVIAMPIHANLEDIQVTQRHGLLVIRVAKLAAHGEEEKSVPVS